MKPQIPEYILTIVQHTYCNDCMWLKNKITDVYHFSGIVRGEDSKHWHINIISPYWSREQRKKNFPKGFATVDVPAMKLEAEDRVILATQDPTTISELLGQLKWMLMNGLSNSEIEERLIEIHTNLGGMSRDPFIQDSVCAD
jgi:hypothetical protein